MVRGDDYRVSAFREQAQQCQQVGVFEPRTGERAERGFFLGEFADDVRFGAGMREDVQEVIDDHRVGVVNPLDVVDQLAARLGAHQFVEGVFVVLAAGGHQPLQKLFFVLVFASLLVVVEPLVGHQLVDGQRHQAGEDGIAGVLCGSGQNAEIEFFIECIIFVK